MSELQNMTSKLRSKLNEIGLSRISDQILEYALPSILIELSNTNEADLPIGASKIGGYPDLPENYIWPRWKGNPIGFIGQFNLHEVSKYDFNKKLPTEGVLSFFYDHIEQPWGYDPDNLGFSHVAYFPTNKKLIRRKSSNEELTLNCSKAIFSPTMTISVMDSQIYDDFITRAKPTEEELNIFFGCSEDIHNSFRRTDSKGYHHLLGYAEPIQGDMQLEAELVTNGLYCGDTSGYNDPRAKELEPLSKQWQLLFQLDSNWNDFMWGDSGMIYYWIREADLKNMDYSKHWMTLQCF